MTKLFRDFFNSEKVGGIILLLCTVASLLIANSSAGQGFVHFWHRQLDLSFAGLNLNYSLEHWINDGLMTIFFLLVGLEIERELYKGELAQVRQAILPIGAALGGMLVPAALYFLFNLGEADRSGFGIPMATDIAFALGMLSLAGNRVPFSLKIFLTALAIIDDLGAILVIAVFYSSGIAWGYLGVAAGVFAGLMVLNKLGIKNLWLYFLPGLIMWYCMMQSGIHATISGVLLAFALPFSPNDRDNPSYRVQHLLHKPVAFVILPLFALANTGIMLSGNWLSELTLPNSAGIMAGLVAGKPAGVLLFCWLMVRFRLAKLPPGVNWGLMTGAGILAGIGFTMSIFISNLAFADAVLVQTAKIAVLTGSLAATVLGLSVLFSLPQKKDAKTENLSETETDG